MWVQHQDPAQLWASSLKFSGQGSNEFHRATLASRLWRIHGMRSMAQTTCQFFEIVIVNMIQYMSTITLYYNYIIYILYIYNILLCFGFGLDSLPEHDHLACGCLKKCGKWQPMCSLAVRPKPNRPCHHPRQHLSCVHPGIRQVSHQSMVFLGCHRGWHLRWLLSTERWRHLHLRHQKRGRRLTRQVHQVQQVQQMHQVPIQHQKGKIGPKNRNVEVLRNVGRPSANGRWLS